MLERDFPNFQVKTFSSLSELMQAVREERIFIGVHGGLQIEFYMRNHPSTAIYRTPLGLREKYSHRI